MPPAKGTDMFEKEALHCPRCGYEIRSELADGEAFVCSVCRSGFRVILDEKSGKAAFYEEAAGQMPEPLHLPRGSIRALVAIAASASAWALIFMDKDVPGSLLSLILAVLAYYFGFRVKVEAAGSRMYDPAAAGSKRRALHLVIHVEGQCAVLDDLLEERDQVLGVHLTRVERNGARQVRGPEDRDCVFADCFVCSC